MSNSLDPDQARHFVGPYVGPNCLQRLPEDDKKSPLAGKLLNGVLDKKIIRPHFEIFSYFSLDVFWDEKKGENLHEMSNSIFLSGGRGRGGGGGGGGRRREESISRL